MPWIQSRRCPPRPEPRALPLILLILMLLGGTGCQLPSGTDIQLASLAQKQEHFELIRAIQPRLDRGEAVPSSQLLFLVGAYAQTRNYARLFPACDLLDAQIRRGDRKMFTGDLAPMPHYIRAQAWLDLGDPSRADRGGPGRLRQAAGPSAAGGSRRTVLAGAAGPGPHRPAGPG